MLPSESAHPGQSPAKRLDMLVRKPGDAYCDAETARRAEAVIKRMLNTPPQPRQQKPRATEAQDATSAEGPRPSG